MQTTIHHIHTQILPPSPTVQQRRHLVPVQVGAITVVDARPLPTAPPRIIAALRAVVAITPARPLPPPLPPPPPTTSCRHSPRAANRLWPPVAPRIASKVAGEEGGRQGKKFDILNLLFQQFIL